MELKYEIAPENLKKLEIKQITLDKEKFGVLTFDKAFPLLDSLRKNLVELEELGYLEKLTEDEGNSIHGIKNRLLEYVRRIYSINPAVDGSFNNSTRDQIESEVKGFYNSATKELRTPLIYLRQEAAKTSTDSQELAQQQNAAAQAEAEYKKLAASLKDDLADLQRRKEEVASTHGEVAAIGLGKYFEAQANEYNLRAREWQGLRSKLFWCLMFIIIANLLLYVGLFIAWKFWNGMNPVDFFTPAYGLVKLALLALLSYAIGFSTRNFNINAGLVATNRHRKNVAETLANTLASPLSDEAKATLAREAAVAMFQNLSIGYIKKEHQNDSGPIHEIIKTILPTNSS